MAHATVAQAVNGQPVAAVLTQARLAAAEPTAWINAINRAALNLDAAPGAFERDVLRMPARRRPAHARRSPSRAVSARQGRPADHAGLARPGGGCARRPSWCRWRHGPR